MIQLAQDARLTLRSLRRNWRFALAFVIPLALGLGAGATFYSIIDYVLYRPPPHVVAPDKLLRIAITTDQSPTPSRSGNTSVAWMDYEALARHSSTLEGVAAYQNYRPSLGVGASARTISAVFATASYFPVLGVHPQVGRFYSVEEDVHTSSDVPCVASDRFWRTELGGKLDALGKPLTVGGLRCTVVGVAPNDFNGTGVTSVDLWVPLRAGANAGGRGDEALWTTDGSHWLQIIARPRAGVELAAVNQDATRAYRSVIDRRRRDPNVKFGMAADRLLGSSASASTPSLKVARWLVGGAIVLVLLVGANLVNLLIARSLGRVRESAMRMALGGTRGRLFRQYLLECVALSILAGTASVLVVQWVGPIARVALFPGTAWAGGPVTGRIVALAMIMSLAVGIVIAALTSLHASRLDPAVLLGAGGGSRTTGTRRNHRARMLLVGVQAALSVVLLVASTGFIRSFRSAANSSLGFDIGGMLFAEVPNFGAVDSTRGTEEAFYADLHDRLKSVPGVEGVSQGYMNPWSNNSNYRLKIPGRDSLPLVPNFGAPAFDAVTADYLKTMHLSLRAGRWISSTDLAGSAPVMVISESLAKLYWPDEKNPIGRCIQVGVSPACREIVGIVQDIRFQGGLDAPLIPSYYLPLAQAAEYHAGGGHLFIRVRGQPAAMVPAIRRLVQSARAGLPAADVHVMQDQLDPLLAPWRLGAMAFTALGSVAATIAMLGLFSLMAYVVAERGREFAIRSALGAQSAQIVIPMLRQGLLVVGGGAAVGTFLAWGTSRWLQPQLYHVRLLDERTVGIVVLGLLIAASLAAVGPARKAASSDPIDALRSD